MTAKCSGRPLQPASSSTASDDVVDAITAAAGSTSPSFDSTASFTERSSETASTTSVQLASSARSVTTGTPVASAARAAESSERAHTRTSPWAAAARARPEPIAPHPAIPSRSFIDSRVNELGSLWIPVRERIREEQSRHMKQGREVVIVEAARTPVGRGHKEKGYYKDTHPNELLGAAYKAVIERAGIEPSEVENVIAGCVQQFGPQGLHVGRNAWLQAGLPIETSATTIDLQCGSAQQAVNLAATQVAAGVHDVVIGGGVEHMGMLPFAAGMKTQEDFGYAFTPELLAQYNIVGQGLGAEMIAEQWEIPRSELDQLAVRSPQLAHQATEEGRFEREMIPMQVNGDTYMTDQGIRPDTNLEALSQLKTVFKEDGVITAGNASQISDGAAAVLLMSADKAAELGLTPRAKIVDQTTVGCDPVLM